MELQGQEHHGKITALLEEWNQGDAEALSALMPLVYDQLCAIASTHLRRERVGHTLDTPGLVHETYLRLLRQDRVQWQNRAHFYSVAARMVRRVLVDHARRYLYAKRGGGQYNIAVEELGDLPEMRDEQVVLVDEALAELSRFDPFLARLVELRFFTGLSIDEVASVLGLSRRTIIRRWRTAKAWLYRFMSGESF